MAGILDKKTRVMDVILTEHGRKEFAKGGFDVKYFSFSDGGVDYTDGGNNVLDIDNSSLISFEAFSNDADILIPEYSNAGDFTLTQGVSPQFQVENGQLLEKNVLEDGTVNISQVSDFGFDDLDLSSMESRWNRLNVLRDAKLGSEFRVIPTSSNIFAKFKPNDDQLNPETLDAIATDPRFSRTVNTMILEPVWQIGNTIEPLDSDKITPLTSSEEFLNEVLESTDTTTDFSISDSDGKFDIIGQVLTIKDSKIRKLLVTQADEVFDEDGTIKYKIFHLGELYKTPIPDSTIDSVTRFGRTMTLVFHDGSLNNG
jgi:hypothetical protein